MTLVKTANGVELAVQSRGDAAKPAVLLVHGFPDDHSVWDGVVDRLADDHHVVTYDVRGCGASAKPRRTADYRLDALADDLQAVIEHIGGDVHLVGHDWGSVQGWHLITRPGHRGVRSFTSISGPCIDHLPGWIRRRARSGGWRDIAALWKSPLYMGVLQIPGLAPALCRRGLVDASVAVAIKAFERPEGRERRPAGPNAKANAESVRMYAANLGPRLRHGDHGGTDVPVQILTPTSDVFVPPASQTDPHPDITTTHIQSVPGGHWAPAYNPDAVAHPIATWIAAHQPSAGEVS